MLLGPAEKAAGAELAAGLRAVLRRDDDYAAAGKPACEYDDPAAREELVDALARDARALLGVLDGQELGPALAQAAELLATVTGQDLEQDAAAVFKIAIQSSPSAGLPPHQCHNARAPAKALRAQGLPAACPGHGPSHSPTTPQDPCDTSHLAPSLGRYISIALC